MTDLAPPRADHAYPLNTLFTSHLFQGDRAGCYS